MVLPVYYPITFFHEPKISSQIISFWGCGITFIWGFRQIIKKMLHWYFTKTWALISIWHFVDNILTWSFVNTYWMINENCCQNVVKTSSVAATAQHCCTNSPNVWSLNYAPVFIITIRSTVFTTSRNIIKLSAWNYHFCQPHWRYCIIPN